MRVGVCSKAREMYRVRRSAHPRGPELIARVPIRSGKVGDWIQLGHMRYIVTYYRLHGEHPGAIALEYNPFGGASRIGERHSALGKAPSACPNLPTRIFEMPDGPENAL